MIFEARTRRFPGEPFEIDGAVLPGAEGDEVWRATASAADFRIAYDGASRIECIDPATGAACAAWVEARLLAPPSGRWAAALMRRVLLQMPLPILPSFVPSGDQEDGSDAGNKWGVHCMGE